MMSAEERHANKEKARRLYEEAFGEGNRTSRPDKVALCFHFPLTP